MHDPTQCYHIIISVLYSRKSVQRILTVTYTHARGRVYDHVYVSTGLEEVSCHCLTHTQETFHNFDVLWCYRRAADRSAVLR